MPGSGNTWQWLRQGPGTAYSYSTTGVTNVAAAGSTALVDVDGDGLDDFVFVKAPGSSISWRRNLTAGGTPSFAAEAVLWTASQGTRIAAQPFVTASQRFRSTERAADFNGDGRGDLLLRVQVDGCGGTAGCTPNWTERLQVFASRGTSLAPQAVFESSADPLLADFNSDGLTDIAWSMSGTTGRLLLATGRRGTADAGLVTQSGGGVPVLATAAKPMVVDWDGDGRSDILVAGTSEWLVCRSLGTMLETCRSAGMAPVGASGSTVVLDANGDGLTDFVHADSALRFRAHDVGAPHLPAAAVTGMASAPNSSTRLSRGRTFTPSVASRSIPSSTMPRPHWSCRGLRNPMGSAERSGSRMPTRARRSTPLVAGSLGLRGKAKDRQPRRHHDGYRLPAGSLGLRAGRRRVGGRGASIRGTPISRTTHYWARLAFGTGYQARSFPYVASSVADRFELDGTWVSSSYTRTQVDSFGTPVTARPRPGR